MFSERVQSRAGQREATRQRVLASAENLFRSHGFQDTTIRQIAADAGVSVGTVMAVGDKGALLVAIFDGWIAAVHHDRAARREGGDRSALGPGEAVREIVSLVEPFIAYFVGDRDLSREYAAIIVRGSHESEVFQSLAAALVGEFEAVLARTPSPAPGPGARTVYYAYLGILMTAGNGSVDEQAAIAQFQEIVQFVVGDEGVQS